MTGISYVESEFAIMKVCCGICKCIDPNALMGSMKCGTLPGIVLIFTGQRHVTYMMYQLQLCTLCSLNSDSKLLTVEVMAIEYWHCPCDKYARVAHLCNWHQPASSC